METNWLNIKTWLQKYEKIMELFHSVDVSVNEEFQRTFNGFYQRRRKPDFYKVSTFFSNHTKYKITFAEVLQYFFMSDLVACGFFSSKVVATINPNMPIWDSEFWNDWK